MYVRVRVLMCACFGVWKPPHWYGSILHLAPMYRGTYPLYSLAASNKQEQRKTPPSKSTYPATYTPFRAGGGSGYARSNGRGDLHQHQPQPQQQQHSSNVNGGNIQLIKAVVCAGLYPNVTVAPASLCPTSTSASATAATAAGGKKTGSGSKGSAGAKGGAAEKTAGEVSYMSSWSLRSEMWLDFSGLRVVEIRNRVTVYPLRGGA